MNAIAGILRGKCPTAALCAAVAFLSTPAMPVAAKDPVTVADNPAGIERQRQLFVRHLEEAELGDRTGIDGLPAEDAALLRSYILWPDLESTYLRATIRQAPDADVERFLATWGSLKPARELRYRYALELARRGQLDRYFDIWTRHYSTLGDPGLDCLALQAQIAAGGLAGTGREELVGHARHLWRIGRSQVDECDPVFESLKADGLLREEDYRERFALAIEAQSFSLARWLGKSIDAEHVAVAQRWLDAQTGPEDFLLAHGRKPADAGTRAQLVYAAERLTYRDPVRAHALWQQVSTRQAFTAEQRASTERHIALWMARDKLPGAAEHLASLPAAAVDDEVWRWRVRMALYNGDWSGAEAWLDAMPGAERDRDEWRYWRAVALRENGAAAAAEGVLAELARERSYYGFLASDALDLPYAFGHATLAPDDAVQSQLESVPELVRARELFLVGLDGRGRSEWDAVVALLSADEQLQAAILAHRWGWHSRAIATVATLGEYDDLELRYPLAFRELFDQGAAAADVPATWAYGIARSESLFMRDVRSGAGAIGVMQVMPATGGELARRLGLPYAGLDTLTDPAANIRLGTTYLGEMAGRFGGNRILATAAYNAGPARVERWVPQQDPVDARIWIENIPYNETRAYVRRVLEAETIFSWRLTGETRRLSDSFVAIQPAESAQRVVSDSR